MNNVIYDIVNYKTNIKVFTKVENKIYRYNIKEFKAINVFDFQGKIKELFLRGLVDVFFKGTSKAYIENKDGSIKVLKHKIVIKEKNLKCSYVKELLIQHKRLTIYRVNEGFNIVIWKA